MQSKIEQFSISLYRAVLVLSMAACTFFLKETYSQMKELHATQIEMKIEAAEMKERLNHIGELIKRK